MILEFQKLRPPLSVSSVSISSFLGKHTRGVYRSAGWEFGIDFWNSNQEEGEKKTPPTIPVWKTAAKSARVSPFRMASWLLQNFVSNKTDFRGCLELVPLYFALLLLLIWAAAPPTCSPFLVDIVCDFSSSDMMKNRDGRKDNLAADQHSALSLCIDCSAAHSMGQMVFSCKNTTLVHLATAIYFNANLKKMKKRSVKTFQISISSTSYLAWIS